MCISSILFTEKTKKINAKNNSSISLFCKYFFILNFVAGEFWDAKFYLFKEFHFFILFKVICILNNHHTSNSRSIILLKIIIYQKRFSEFIFGNIYKQKNVKQITVRNFKNFIAIFQLQFQEIEICRRASCLKK